MEPCFNATALWIDFLCGHAPEEARGAMFLSSLVLQKKDTLCHNEHAERRELSTASRLLSCIVQLFTLRAFLMQWRKKAAHVATVSVQAAVRRLLISFPAWKTLFLFKWKTHCATMNSEQRSLHSNPLLYCSLSPSGALVTEWRHRALMEPAFTVNRSTLQIKIALFH